VSRNLPWLALVLSLAFVVTTPLAAAAAAPADETGRVVELVNAQRARYGLPALRWEARLASAAADYATYLAESGLFSHFAEDGAGLAQRDEAHGYAEWSFLGENLARGFATPEEVVAAWLASPSHRANLLAVEACHVGIGRATSYWAMEIGC
jgi:uncharacterized protein YkwD